ncbi:MAG: exonuclease SbcCD subunit D [Campylobacterota bacterium]|nr:exonuclease SbcCD subunit D [Campylobacterota bacterium]
MKILHFSDTHLGYNDLDIINENNINQREADFYDAFSKVVDDIKTLKPDYIIHTGDLFHRTSPSNRAITFALEQFKVINSLGIPFILIAGNHETPRTNLSSPILKIFDNFENIYSSYDQKYKKIEFEDIIFHTLPHMNDETKAQTQIDTCEKNIDQSKKNIMMLHCSVGAWYLMQEFGEWVYPTSKEYIFEKMDYVALGHWHGFGSVGKHPNVYYSGSLERTSLNDKRDSKGYVLVNIDEELKVEYKEIKIRPIVTKEIDSENYETSMNDIDISNCDNAIVEVTLKNLTPSKSIDIPNQNIKELFPNAMSVTVKREFIKDENTKEIEDIEAVSLQEYFLDHIKDASSDEKENERLKAKVQELFRSYEEMNNDID